MSTAKLPLIVLLAYVGVVVAFESALGYLQPTSEGTIVITTTDREGAVSYTHLTLPTI